VTLPRYIVYKNKSSLNYSLGHRISKIGQCGNWIKIFHTQDYWITSERLRNCPWWTRTSKLCERSSDIEKPALLLACKIKLECYNYSKMRSPLCLSDGHSRKCCFERSLISMLREIIKILGHLELLRNDSAVFRSNKRLCSRTNTLEIPMFRVVDVVYSVTKLISSQVKYTFKESNQILQFKGKLVKYNPSGHFMSIL